MPTSPRFPKNSFQTEIKSTNSLTSISSTSTIEDERINQSFSSMAIGKRNYYNTDYIHPETDPLTSNRTNFENFSNDDYAAQIKKTSERLTFNMGATAVNSNRDLNCNQMRNRGSPLAENNKTPFTNRYKNLMQQVRRFWWRKIFKKTEIL